ncbi:MAG: DUF4912 domain-containing protein [Planktothrix sp.]|uniref:DUF4912 domain-containing protein n=1 Tax=Planktothrix sp. TaxID=3088171 RepID=UPI0038D3A28D
MLLNKKDTSIVTLTLLLSIATSPVAWATSRWPSNASVADSTKLPESSLLSSKQVRTINLDQLPLNHHNEWDFKLKPMSTSEVVLLSQLDSPPPQPKLNHDTLVGQSSQVQQATISATEGEIPIWLWWLLPTLPILGFWIGLQLKAQRSKSANQLSNDSITPILSTQSDVPTQHTQIDSSPILGEEIKLPESTESLKTPLSSIVFSVSVPRTILRKRNQTDPELASVETRVIQEVTEAVLIEEIDETEAETVIAEFKTINGEQGIAEIENRIEPEISVSEILEPQEDISSEPMILESEIEEKPQIIAEIENRIEPEISVSEIAKTEPEETELGVAHQEVRSETDVAATKFNLGREIKFEPSLADVDQGLPALPDGYGQSQIFLLPRDPNWAYAYWDVPNDHKEYIRQQGGKYLLLRVYDVTGIDMDTHPPFSIQEYECDEMTREWYIPIPMSDRDYIAELGYQTLDGRWLMLVRSNHIRIPPIYPTDWENYQFINVPWNQDLRGKTQFRL